MFNLSLCAFLRASLEIWRGWILDKVRRLIVLGKLAKRLFPLTHALPHVSTHAGDIFYIVGVLVGLIMWGFGIVWFVVAVIMIAVSGGFPFNMGWWGFIFPVGQYNSSSTPGPLAYVLLVCQRHSRNTLTNYGVQVSSRS
jgi:Voltage-dependent anion channel